MAILARSFRAVFLQPAFLMCLALHAAAVGFLVFGVSFLSGHGTVDAIMIAGSRPQGIAFFVRQILPVFTGGLVSVTLFLFILVCSGLAPELVGDPVLPILLTKGAGKRKVFLLHVAGVVAALWVDVCCLCLSIPLVLYGKTGNLFAPVSAEAALVFMVLTLLLTSLAAIVGIITKKGLTSAGILLLLHFLVGPFLTFVGASMSPLLRGFLLIVPPTSILGQSVSDSALGNAIPGTAVFQALVIVVFSLTAATEIFRRKDF